MSGTSPCDLGAVELAGLLAAGELSAVELLDACLQRIARTNPDVNAIVTLDERCARADAERADRARRSGEQLGSLHGLPIAHKDDVETAGTRTTFGSPVFADNVPATDALRVQRVRAAGAVLVGKTNLPEFGAGSHTFNPLFGATANPYALDRSAGGSSGGSAAALACGMVPLADGSDMGGSLRNPASFCNVVGLRPTPGRVPSWPVSDPWDPLTVEGPMGRSVADTALLLSVLAGPHPRAPLSLPEPGVMFMAPLDADLRGLRVAVSERLGDLPVDPSVVSVVRAAVGVLRSLGCTVENVDPPEDGADEVFETMRGLAFERDLGPLLEGERSRLKPAIVWNIEAGRALRGGDVARAQVLRGALVDAWHDLFERHDALLAPVSQLPPFPIECEYPSSVAGVAMRSYIEWMRSCSRVSVTGHPALSVPGGFTGDGLPVGIQLVGRPGEELGLLRLGHAFEQATGHGHRRPPLGV